MGTRRQTPWLMIAGGVLCIAGVVSWGVSRFQARQAVVETAEIYSALHLEPTSRVADVGGGTGTFSLELARVLALDGYVYATEIDIAKLAGIRVAVAEAGLDNVTTLESSADKTGLPPGCCDGVFLRTVYHHLTEPEAVAADLFSAVRPGGRMAIIDFEPRGWLSLVSPVEGVDEGRARNVSGRSRVGAHRCRFCAGRASRRVERWKLLTRVYPARLLTRVGEGPVMRVPREPFLSFGLAR